MELYYKTPRAFLYQMNRLSSEDWEREQLKDNNAEAPVTLARLEPGADSVSIAEWLENEKGFNYRPDHKTDMQVCQLIDNMYLPSYGKSSVYQLDDRAKLRLAERLAREHCLPHAQLHRCLAVR